MTSLFFFETAGIKAGHPWSFICDHCVITFTPIMSKVTYPRACPKCGRKINNWGNFSRLKKRCGTSEYRVQCAHCPKTYSRPDNLKKHFKNAHSEAAKRKAEDSAELARLELLHTNKVPRLSLGDQSGGAVSTRGMQQESKTMGQNPTKTNHNQRRQN